MLDLKSLDTLYLIATQCRIEFLSSVGSYGFNPSPSTLTPYPAAARPGCINARATATSLSVRGSVLAPLVTSRLIAQTHNINEHSNYEVMH